MLLDLSLSGSHLPNAPILAKRAGQDSPTESDVSTDDSRAAGTRQSTPLRPDKHQSRYSPFATHFDRYTPTATRRDRSIPSTRRDDDHVAPAERPNDYFALVAGRRKDHSASTQGHIDYYAVAKPHQSVIKRPRRRAQSVQIGESAKQRFDSNQQPTLRPKFSSRLEKVSTEEKKSNLMQTIRGKRLSDPMPNDHEASTSGTKQIPIPKRKRVASNQRGEIDSKRRKTSLDQDTRGGIVSGGIKIFNDAKKTVKEYCDAACQRARQHLSGAGQRVSGLRDRLTGRRRPQSDTTTTAEERMARRVQRRKSLLGKQVVNRRPDHDKD